MLLTLETLRMLRASGGEAAMAASPPWYSPRPTSTSTCSRAASSALAPMPKRLRSSPPPTTARSPSRAGLPAARAGAAEREKLEALGVRVADASDYRGGITNLITHDLFLSNQEVQQVVKRALERAG
jgi:hypothetical protein